MIIKELITHLLYLTQNKEKKCKKNELTLKKLIKEASTLKNSFILIFNEEIKFPFILNILLIKYLFIK